ncbi:MAG: DUF6057 family protein [Prevotellaceae bacterium]|nr:DUF6057 family protein [Prevotellaceae bacterium]
MKHIHYIYTLFFGVSALLFFGLAYPHHLHYQEQYQLFLFEISYILDVVALPGGVADLLGRFSTQFFLYAWAGAAIIAVLLSVVQLLTLRLANWGRFYGLSYVPAFLLWIFLLDENALLGGVWAVVLTLSASLAIDKMTDGWTRRILTAMLIPFLFWIAGPVSIVFCILQIRRANHIIWNIATVLVFVLMPLVLAHCLPVLDGSLWRGIHYHRYPTVIPTMLWMAVLALVILLGVQGVKGVKDECTCRYKSHTINDILLTFASFAFVAVVMAVMVWKNSNFKAEKTMKYDFMACHQQWNRIFDTIDEEKPNNQIGVTVQNLALAKRGILLNKMLEYNQNGMLGLLPDVQRDATSPMPTAEAYYHLGLTYIAQRTVFEAQEAILDFQKSARCYKRLAQTNLINGDYEVARKYLMVLKKTLFYSDWANETITLLGNEKAIAKHPEYGTLRAFAIKKDFYFSDNATPAMLESLYLSNKNNLLAYQYMMASFILTGDRESFYKYAQNK